MTDVVTWRETDVPDQFFGRVGKADLFIVGKESETGVYRLGRRDPFTSNGSWIKFADAPFASRQEAQRAAEERIEWVLALLDLVPRQASLR